MATSPLEKKKDLLEVSTLLRLWWGEKRRPQAVGDTSFPFFGHLLALWTSALACPEVNGDAAHIPDLLRPKSAAEQFQASCSTPFSLPLFVIVPFFGLPPFFFTLLGP